MIVVLAVTEIPPAAMTVARLTNTPPGGTLGSIVAEKITVNLPPGGRTSVSARSVRPSQVAGPSRTLPGSSPAGNGSVRTTWRTELLPVLVRISVYSSIAPGQTWRRLTSFVRRRLPVP
jgi:hypothetical protein